MEENVFHFIGIRGRTAVYTTEEVIKMDKKYPDLYALIAENQQAHSYFSTLPDYVQEEIDHKATRVNSFESLRDYAENLTRGDN